MKRNIHLISVILILISLQSFGQENSIVKIDVGGTSILIPTPDNNFIEVGGGDRKIIGIQVPETNNLKAVFLLKEVYQKIGDKPIPLKKTIMVEVVKVIENLRLSEKDFIDFKTEYAKSLSSLLSDATISVNLNYAKIKDIVGNAEIGKPTVLGDILDIKDAFADLISMKVKTDNGSLDVVTGTLIIRIKDKILFIYVSNELKDDESLTWVSNIIKTWSKQLLNLNEEKLP